MEVKASHIPFNWKYKVSPLTTDSGASLLPKFILPASIDKVLVLIFTLSLVDKLIDFWALNNIESVLAFIITLSEFNIICGLVNEDIDVGNVLNDL